MKRALNQIRQSLLTKRAAVPLAGVFAVGSIAAMSSPVQAGTSVDFDIRLGSSSGYDDDYAPTVRRVWVEPVYRSVTERVWVEPIYTTKTESVWVEERVVQWTEVTYGHGPFARRERVPYRVEPAHYETRESQVQVQPGRWEEQRRQELVFAGYWKEVPTSRGPIVRIEGRYDGRDHDRDRWDRRDDDRHDRRDDDRHGSRRW